MAVSSFIESMKTDQPMIWAKLLEAAADGLVFIDEETDAVTATNRLLLTYPDLHDLLNFFTDQWVEMEMTKPNFFKDLLKESIGEGIG